MQSNFNPIEKYVNNFHHYPDKAIMVFEEEMAASDWH
jgi:hypothetical protein